jgi:hypothetical protein
MTQQVIVAGNNQGFGTARKLRAALSKADTNFTEVNADVVLAIPISLHASKVIYNMFVARRAYQVTQIDWVGDIAQAITGTVVKAIGTATPASATTPMHTAAGVVCSTTAHTVLPIALTGTAADLLLATGDRIAFVLGAALTTGSGTLVIRMKRV